MTALAQRLKNRFFQQEHPYQIFESEVNNRLEPGNTLLDAGCGRTAPVLEKYIGRGLVLRSAEPAGVSLARPPEQIPATEILDILHGPADPGGDNSDPVSEFLRRREAIIHENLAAVTLKDLANPDRSL